jgi:hypothetical protein
MTCGDAMRKSNLADNLQIETTAGSSSMIGEAVRA